MIYDESEIAIQNRLNSMSYNTFKDMSLVPYQIVTDYLFDNEDIWKLIYYTLDEKGNPIVKPLEMPNLTAKQKRDLIYQGVDDVNKLEYFLQCFLKTRKLMTKFSK